VTVIDTGGVLEFLLGWGSAAEVEGVLTREGELHAPDILVFELLSALRRQVRRSALARERAQRALVDLEDLQMRLYPSLALRFRAWELRENLAAADGLFVALAEQLGEPLATTDRALARACASLDEIGTEVVALGA
jgi:predicted nucleic acid-binding protein